MEVVKNQQQVMEITKAVFGMSEGEKFSYLSQLPAAARTAYFSSLSNLAYVQTVEEMEEARHYKIKSQQKNTAKTYKNAAILFNDYCAYLGAAPVIELTDEKGAQLLQAIAPPQMLGFIGHLANNGNPIKGKGPYKHNSIKTYCLALGSLHTDSGAASPMTKKAYQRLKEIKEATPNAKQAPRLRQGQIIKVVRQFDLDTNKGKRDQFLLMLGYLGGFRRSELASLEFTKNEHGTNNYLYIDNSTAVERLVIVLQDHKTAKDSKTHTRSIEANPNNLNLCPVEAFRNWKACTNADGKIFKSVNKRSDKIHSTNAIAGEGIDKLIRAWFGVDEDTKKAFSAHSLRVGLACDLYLSGATLEQIKRHMNWKEYGMIEHYLKELPNFERSPIGGLIFYKTSNENGLIIKAS